MNETNIQMHLNQYIEHTLLKADTKKKEIEKLCAEAIQFNFFGVCVPPYFVKTAKNCLKNSTVKIVTVVGFPLGYASTPAKVEEAKKALDEGAHEIDMVINITAVKNEDYNYVSNDIQSLCTIVQLKGGKLKVIIETAMLTKAQKIKACEICNDIGVDFVKTSTGFAKSGVSIEDVKIIKQNVSPKIKIKASGGIKTKEFAIQLIEAGASRLGTSSGVELIK